MTGRGRRGCRGEAGSTFWRQRAAARGRRLSAYRDLSGPQQSLAGGGNLGRGNPCMLVGARNHGSVGSDLCSKTIQGLGTSE